MMITIQQLYEIFLEQSSVSIDSRNCPVGSIFFAIRGDNFDGNKYILQALDNGCAYAVGDSSSVPKLHNVFKVDDSLKTLQALASHHRKQLNTPILAITGTNGKTTTKELIAAVLATQYQVLFTEGNLNNHIGMPLTLLKLKQEHQIAVVEMGASHRGEIKELAEIALPNMALITNVGKAHLEGFGSFENIIVTKKELYDYIHAHGGQFFMNVDNEILEVMINANRLDIIEPITYGTRGHSSVRGKVMEINPFLQFEWSFQEQTHRVNSQLVGAYNLENFLAAIAVGLYMNVCPRNINLALSSYKPTNKRSEMFVSKQNNALIIDTYNANPTSMWAAISNFKQIPHKSKILILGDMLELGPYSLQEHEKIVSSIKGSDFEKVYLCGKIFCEVLTPSLTPSHFIVVGDVDRLVKILEKAELRDCQILLKGSRGIHLERCIEFL